MTFTLFMKTGFVEWLSMRACFLMIAFIMQFSQEYQSVSVASISVHVSEGAWCPLISSLKLLTLVSWLWWCQCQLSSLLSHCCFPLFLSMLWEILRDCVNILFLTILLLTKLNIYCWFLMCNSYYCGICKLLIFYFHYSFYIVEIVLRKSFLFFHRTWTRRFLFYGHCISLLRPTTKMPSVGWLK